MIRYKSILLGVLVWLLHLTSFGQADPAVTSRNLLPAPIVGGIGTPLSMTFTIGNNGAQPISGANVINQMGFTITLGNCDPSPAGTGALSGALLNYFDIIYVASSNSFLATQKTGVVLNPLSVFDLVIAATVTRASSSSAIDDIGASCNIQPPPALNTQPTSNDFASIYTHTVSPLPVSLVSFTAQGQTDHTVLLNWSTSWEQSNKAYVVERSKDLTTFEEVGRVTDVAGTSKAINTYHLTDARPYRGTSYYRLKQLDLDGSSRTYPAVSVNVEGVYGVYPNPISATGFTLSLDEPATAILHLYNASGRSVDLQKNSQTESSVELKTTESLPSGIYLLTVEERAQVRKYRLVVQ
ncbi:T9SS type A sorting domain-containing protein [Spirosoma jeollabukense]